LNYENDDLDESVEATEPISFDMQALLEGTISNETDLTEVTVELVPEAIDKPEEEITLDENQNSDQRKSFYDWLNVSPADSKTGNYEDVNKKMLQENQSTSPLKNEVEDIVFEQSESIPEKSKEKVQSLVDKFIEAEPRISRPKAEFFSPVKSAKESVSEEGIPVSETLAKIYELQGNYPKAIAVLEKLMELIPNKSETFATKITEIKSKMVG
jgi:tetratricopeptide (TPR) repeat protein